MPPALLMKAAAVVTVMGAVIPPHVVPVSPMPGSDAQPMSGPAGGGVVQDPAVPAPPELPPLAETPSRLAGGSGATPGARDTTARARAARGAATPICAAGPQAAPEAAVAPPDPANPPDAGAPPGSSDDGKSIRRRDNLGQSEVGHRWRRRNTQRPHANRRIRAIRLTKC
ncbi:MAG: hypothetical protein ABJA82_06995 [Myxococcales bacterium]